ncbi:glycoside hydrolase family 88 protein [Bosea sp. (in: a-proteobacteria)]|uniref:glycoside hydrolase family 88 protein n=1 Tax=Bosea sp. (in: a-proteobacteria) TaxID=1871050 RepID=UPI0025C2F453|nr:glycoside hydrolase family 88 protein [Bosea sp. (in: a-proteobacteria)]
MVTFQADRTFWRQAQVNILQRVSSTIDQNLSGFPHIGDPETGEWVTTPDGFWTGGFWIGELWLAASVTGEARYLEAAKHWLERLEPRVESRTVFRGFLFYYGAVIGALLHGDRKAAALAERAAQSLGRQFDPIANLIPLGKEAEEAHSVGDGEANIDGLPAAPVMLWAAQHLGDDELRQRALKHAKRSAEFFLRDDGGVIQSASFDTATGKVIRRYTHKGYADDSIWTRAQAWAMLGFVLSARLERSESSLIQLAEKVCDWWLANIPQDRVAYWDFNAPVAADTKRDTSGTAIAAAALLKLSQIHPEPNKAAAYRGAAEATARALVERHLNSKGILTDGCFDPKNGTAVSNELIWGDYFLFETVATLNGDLHSSV